MADKKLKLYNALDRCETLLYSINNSSNNKIYKNILLYGLRYCLDYDKLTNVHPIFNNRWAYKSHKTMLSVSRSIRLANYV